MKVNHFLFISFLSCSLGILNAQDTVQVRSDLTQMVLLQSYLSNHVSYQKLIKYYSICKANGGDLIETSNFFDAMERKFPSNQQDDILENSTHYIYNILVESQNLSLPGNTKKELLALYKRLSNGMLSSVPKPFVLTERENIFKEYYFDTLKQNILHTIIFVNRQVDLNVSSSIRGIVKADYLVDIDSIHTIINSLKLVPSLNRILIQSESEGELKLSLNDFREINHDIFSGVGAIQASTISRLRNISTARNSLVRTQQIAAGRIDFGDMQSALRDFNIAMDFAVGIGKIENFAGKYLEGMDKVLFSESDLINHVQDFISNGFTDQLTGLSASIFTGGIVGVFSFSGSLFDHEYADIKKELEDIKKSINELSDLIEEKFEIIDYKLNLILGTVEQGFANLNARTEDILAIVRNTEVLISDLRKDLSDAMDDLMISAQETQLADLQLKLNYLGFRDRYGINLPFQEFTNSENSFHLAARTLAYNRTFVAYPALNNLSSVNDELSNKFLPNLNLLNVAIGTLTPRPSATIPNPIIYRMAATGYFKLICENPGVQMTTNDRLIEIVNVGNKLHEFANSIRYRDSANVIVINRALFNKLFSNYKNEVKNFESLLRNKYYEWLSKTTSVTEDSYKIAFLKNKKFNLFDGLFQNVGYVLKEDAVGNLPGTYANHELKFKGVMSNGLKLFELLDVGNYQLFFTENLSFKNVHKAREFNVDGLNATFCKLDGSFSASFELIAELITKESKMKVSRIDVLHKPSEICSDFRKRASIASTLSYRDLPILSPDGRTYWKIMNPVTYLKNNWATINNEINSFIFRDTLDESSRELLKLTRARVSFLREEFLKEIIRRLEKGTDAELNKGLEQMEFAALVLKNSIEIAFEEDFLKKDNLRIPMNSLLIRQVVINHFKDKVNETQKLANREPSFVDMSELGALLVLDFGMDELYGQGFKIQDPWNLNAFKGNSLEKDIIYNLGNKNIRSGLHDLLNVTQSLKELVKIKDLIE